MKFIRKRLNEGMFKNPEQARAARNKEKSLSSVDKLTNTIKANIQSIASNKCDKKIIPLLVSQDVDERFSIFSSNKNEAAVKSINYSYSGNNLICECVVSLSSNGTDFNDGTARLIISSPENVGKIEELLSSEFDCQATVKIKLVEDDHYAGTYSSCVLFTEPKGSYDRRILELKYSEADDLTPFVHMMNCIENINWNYYRFTLNYGITGQSPMFKIPKIYSSETLKNKFGWISFRGFELSYVTAIRNSKMFLSNSVAHKSLIDSVVGRMNVIPENIEFTGMIDIEAKEVCHSLDDVVTAARMTAAAVKNNYAEYPNLYVNISLAPYFWDGQKKAGSDGYRKEVTTLPYFAPEQIAKKYPCNNLSLQIKWSDGSYNPPRICLYNIEQ